MLGKNTREREKVVPETPRPTSTAVPSHSVIGKGLTITGNCVTEGHVRIEGTVTGNVTSNGIEVADSGLVDGDISVPKGGKKGQVFVVTGRVTGRVRAHIVDVKRSGTVLGGIEAEEATIHGTVEGGVTVRHRLAVLSTAVLSGDVRTDRLMMEEGGRVNGTIIMGREANESSRKDEASRKEGASRAEEASPEAEEEVDTAPGAAVKGEADTPKAKPAAA